MDTKELKAKLIEKCASRMRDYATRILIDIKQAKWLYDKYPEAQADAAWRRTPSFYSLNMYECSIERMRERAFGYNYAMYDIFDIQDTTPSGEPPYMRGLVWKRFLEAIYDKGIGVCIEREKRKDAEDIFGRYIFQDVDSEPVSDEDIARARAMADAYEPREEFTIELS